MSREKIHFVKKLPVNPFNKKQDDFSKLPRSALFQRTIAFAFNCRILGFNVLYVKTEAYDWRTSPFILYLNRCDFSVEYF